ncbi:hypothetical protein RHMOL_Rhmol09G0103700 [Rhododendron molle]|uniref:Uncharacterized protein n=1 Tax=Rhododendron molle TaxID=49168 RepID=A0ACC0MC69_RHOML|nr:hypothetical protein RHMOL_Rhmol09G0103700 [Rhododendron molle]
MEGSSPSIDPFFDPLVGSDFEIEIESNSIDNHMMTEEKKDTVMDSHLVWFAFLKFLFYIMSIMSGER